MVLSSFFTFPISRHHKTFPLKIKFFLTISSLIAAPSFYHFVRLQLSCWRFLKEKKVGSWMNHHRLLCDEHEMNKSARSDEFLRQYGTTWTWIFENEWKFFVVDNFNVFVELKTYKRQQRSRHWWKREEIVLICSQNFHVEFSSRKSCGLIYLYSTSESLVNLNFSDFLAHLAVDTFISRWGKENSLVNECEFSQRAWNEVHLKLRQFGPIWHFLWRV